MGWHHILRLLCFHFLLHSSLRFALPFCPPDQRDALLHFKNSFMLDSKASDPCYWDSIDSFYHERNFVKSYPKTNSWYKGMDCCSWDGVTCDGATGNIISLDLTCSWLCGTLHSNSSLFLLRHLQKLNLFGNNFTGSHISSNLSAFATLTHLNVSSSSFSGSIPSEISHLSKLVSLDLSSNFFSDTLENSIFTMLVQNLTTLRKLFLDEVNMSMVSPKSFANLSSSLTYLSVVSCSLRGIFPNAIFRLPSLSTLYIGNNKNLSGILPKSNWTSPLESLSLWRTSFSGEIPDSIGNMKNLTVLDLENCKFTGHIPSSMQNLNQLQLLWIDKNSFSGVVEFELFTKLTNLRKLSVSQELNLIYDTLEYTFPKLEVLQLTSCNLTKFPYFLNSLKRLTLLDLSSNRISGEIPMWFWGVSQDTLELLDLSNNLLEGGIQLLHWKKLSSIYLLNNSFHGPLPILPPSTHYFAASNNSFTGEIPSLICQFSSLLDLDLSNNNFSGNMPLCFGNLTNLQNLYLSNNKLQGPLPRSLVKCSLVKSRYLEVLDLSHNQIEDTFPGWLGSLPELKVLVLRSNNLKDLLDIPRGAHLFPKLHILDLSNNSFGDTSLYMTRSFERKTYENSVVMMMKGLEVELVRILTFLTIIDLSCNSFEGNIPEVIGHLHSLVGLNLSHNHLTGSIPPTLGNLTNLEWLDLSSNKLSWVIPRKLGDLASLGYLNLSKNQLIGRIPQDKQLSTFSRDSFGGNPGLCGTPLPKACLGDAQPPLPSSLLTFDHEGHESWFNQKIVWMGYASGIVIGISIAYIAFETGRPKWLMQGLIEMLPGQLEISFPL
ncbi:hypothetical protein EUGRSUZ_F00696 [Eucalyptus grandis]|uniref:Uncharacterized protein n=2 Tax=Eucalyptus grandis TaxID=71139 RepID=A0ACC3KD83_EUCGR|nr:hypothetical protein EUGRSUZ_F00696 [Eucalyptus grandis]